MKVLSIKQPFVELILSGKKTIELRTWNTKFRGEFLIHASKNPDKEAMQRFGFEDLPTSKILGKVTLIDVKNYEETKDFEKDNNKHLASKNWGGFGFILKDAKRISPIEINGKLGFWNYDLKII
jgi:predicted transcriptional regulator